MDALGDQDVELLRFAAAQRLFSGSHAAALLGETPGRAQTRIRRLEEAGLLITHRVFQGEPPVHLVTRRGLSLLDLRLGAPRLDLASYAHDLGVAWLWLAAQAGRLGAVAKLTSERTLRSAHAQAVLHGDGGAPGPPLAVRLGGVGPTGHPRLHFPDILLTRPDGRRLALELERSAKGQARLRSIMRGYVLEPGIEGVLYLVDRPVVARAVRGAARAAGAGELVRVQPFRWVAREPGRFGGAAVARRVRTAAAAGSRSAGAGREGG